MSLKERVYSVLVISAAEGFNDALTALLPEARYSPVQFATNVGAARRALAERAFDIVIINSPLPDETGIRFAIDASNSKETVVLLMIRAELQEEVFDRVAEHGVFVLSKPTALSWLSSARERLRKTEKKTLSIEEKMEEIRIVNRAKWLLISELKFDEPGAHRYIEKQAMDRCVSRKVIAEEIITTYS